METIRWDDVEDWFDPSRNGSAPDVVVPDTAMADWETLLELIRSKGWRGEYMLGDERRPLPTAAAELFDPDPEGVVRSLWVWPDPDLEWIIRPWSPDVIVSDVNLYEIQGQERLDALCRFLQTLGKALAKSVLVYGEGAYDDYPPMMEYEATKDQLVFLAGPWR